MSVFYGTVQGNHGEATRQGSNVSGIRGSVQSWNGSIITSMWYDSNSGELCCCVKTNDGSSSCTGETIFRGTFDQLKAGLKLAQENIVKNNKK